jgi:hypothetical protein
VCILKNTTPSRRDSTEDEVEGVEGEERRESVEGKGGNETKNFLIKPN